MPKPGALARMEASADPLNLKTKHLLPVLTDSSSDLGLSLPLGRLVSLENLGSNVACAYAGTDLARGEAAPKG